ncbi:DUF3784 domain-containing protein [Rossellomorea sp. YZS02]|uniref:DUF3784 domain-containing protein n=1 Tax=Rossellomorea sp. YZS02 TaxID=3097358 RepID=UPI002A14B58D|nr:DUF3784 domain-containing protein [Rossellomorea sp. YZS02]MDX8342491.1 DUF3784 domain-containing protein [Rossellomorea sp. YZS02]
MYLPFIICICVGLLIAYLGYLIRVKKKLYLIAGYQDDAYKGDKEKLAKVFGLYIMIVGMMTMILPFALEFIGLYTGTVFGILIGVSAIVLSVYVMRNQMRT